MAGADTIRPPRANTFVSPTLGAEVHRRSCRQRLDDHPWVGKGRTRRYRPLAKASSHLPRAWRKCCAGRDSWWDQHTGDSPDRSPACTARRYKAFTLGVGMPALLRSYVIR